MSHGPSGASSHEATALGQQVGLALTLGYVVMSIVGVSYESFLLHWFRASNL